MKALLVNYEYCTGCHSCEIACRNERGLGKGEYGIMVTEVGPLEFKTDIGLAGEPYDWVFSPVVTRACDLCEKRAAAGKLPACVQACQAWCLYYGEAEELIKKLDGKSRWTLISQGA